MESNSIAPLKGETLYKAALCCKRNLFVCFLYGALIKDRKPVSVMILLFAENRKPLYSTEFTC